MIGTRTRPVPDTVKRDSKKEENMKLKFALAAAALMTAQSASAATLQLSYDSSAAGYRTVVLNEVPVAVAGGLTRVSAGGFNMVDSTPGGLGAFVAFCLDLGAFLGTSGDHEYETTDAPFGNSGVNLVGAGIGRIASIFNANYSDAVTSNRDSSAAFQMALWEAVYDDDMNIDTGLFQASSTTDAVNDLASEFLAAADGYTGPNLWDLSFLESTASNRRQNLVTAAPSAVPLPASGLLLLAAFGGLAAARRRKTA